MLYRAAAVVVVLFFMAGNLLAADREVKGTVVKVDAKKMALTVTTEEGRKTYTISQDTKFIGPKGGVSDEGIRDDRLAPGAEITIVIAGNNRTVREIRLPERKPKK
jgi:hypothetical protein